MLKLKQIHASYAFFFKILNKLANNVLDLHANDRISPLVSISSHKVSASPDEFFREINADLDCSELSFSSPICFNLFEVSPANEIVRGLILSLQGRSKVCAVFQRLFTEAFFHLSHCLFHLRYHSRPQRKSYRKLVYIVHAYMFGKTHYNTSWQIAFPKKNQSSISFAIKDQLNCSCRALRSSGSKLADDEPWKLFEWRNCLPLTLKSRFFLPNQLQCLSGRMTRLDITYPSSYLKGC